MKIVAGLGSLQDYDAYVEAGADELFCGCMPLDWLEAYGVTVPLNRREVLLYPTQIASMTDMRILARLSRADGIPVTVTFNSTCYAPAHYPVILRMMRTLTDMGIDRFIVADPALIRRMPRECRIHVSGEWGEFNRASMEFLREDRPARLIFHRKVTPDEMRACIGAMPGIEYEAFVLNERCYYTGAMCNSLHCDELPHLCKIPWKPGGIEAPAGFPEPIPAACDPDLPGASGCGLCAIPALRNAGVTHLKLVGRGNLPSRMVRDIRLLRRALDDDPAEMRTLFPNGCGGACYYAPQNCTT